MTKILKKSDIFLIAAAIVVAIGIFFLTRPGGEAAYIEVSQNGEIVEKLPLGTDTVFEFSGNTFEIKDEAARMIFADCPDGYCLGHAPISKDGESIVCLPNRVILAARSAEKPDLDDISG